MKNKRNVLSCVFCGIVILVCLICYSGYVSELYYKVCTPYAYPSIAGWEAVLLETMPEGYLLPDDGMSEDADRMKVVEITYELDSRVNETWSVWGNLCYYGGENGEWLSVLEKDEDYWGVRNYENCNIVPPGERVIFKEYVLVPEGMREISAHRSGGRGESEPEIRITL